MLDMYMWFQEPTGGAREIKGESQDQGLRQMYSCQPIKIKQFGFEIANATTIGSASGGASSGRCVLNPFSISKVTDSCSPDFFGACATGGHYGKAWIFLRKDNKPYICYIFSMCFVTKVNWSGGESDESPGESIEFAYGALRIEYYPQDSKGNIKGNAAKISMWNQVNNSPTDHVVEH
jgi:type VI secretion system secreted protein Hcp